MIKNTLIGRKQEFITRQRINELKNTVVPVTDIDDPLILDPPHLIDADYHQRKLLLYLNCTVTEKWIYEIRNMRASYPSVMNKGPEHFHFSANMATIQTEGDPDCKLQNSMSYFLYCFMT